MTLRNSFPTDLPAGLPVLDTRLALATLIARDTDGVPRVGVVPDSLDPVVTGRATMSYSVRDHRAVTSRTGTGVEYLANDGATVVNTTPAPSANARYDIIYERARFALNGDGSSTPEIGVVQGTAALNPTRPGIPAGAVALAEAYVPSGVSSTTSSGVVITQVHPWTAAAGGTVVVRSQAELDTWTPADGARAYNLADNGDYVRVGEVWLSSASSARVYLNGDLVPSSGTATSVAFNAVEHDTGGLAAGGGIRVNRTGVWVISAQACFGNKPTLIAADIGVAGIAYSGTSLNGADADPSARINTSGMARLSAGSLITLDVRGYTNNSSATRVYGQSAWQTWLSATFLG